MSDGQVSRQNGITVDQLKADESLLTSADGAQLFYSLLGANPSLQGSPHARSPRDLLDSNCKSLEEKNKRFDPTIWTSWASAKLSACSWAVTASNFVPSRLVNSFASAIGSSASDIEKVRQSVGMAIQSALHANSIIGDIVKMKDTMAAPNSTSISPAISTASTTINTEDNNTTDATPSVSDLREIKVAEGSDWRSRFKLSTIAPTLADMVIRSAFLWSHCVGGSEGPLALKHPILKMMGEGILTDILTSGVAYWLAPDDEKNCFPCKRVEHPEAPEDPRLGTLRPINVSLDHFLKALGSEN